MTAIPKEEDVIRCDHIETRWCDPIFQFALGTNRTLHLCHDCARRLASMVMWDSVEQAITRDIQMGMMGKRFDCKRW